MTTQPNNPDPADPAAPAEPAAARTLELDPRQPGSGAEHDAPEPGALATVSRNAATTPPARVMPASKAPAGVGAVSGLGLLLAVLMTAAGVVLARDALLYAKVITGQAWVANAAHAINGVGPATWMVPAGAALCLLGLWFLVTALRPRPRKAVALTAETGVFLRPRDLARLAETAAQDVSGVLKSRVTATRRRVTVRVHTTGDGGTSDRVHAAVTDRLAPLQNPPTVRVRAEGERA